MESVLAKQTAWAPTVKPSSANPLALRSRHEMIQNFPRVFERPTLRTYTAELAHQVGSAPHLVENRESLEYM